MDYTIENIPDNVDPQTFNTAGAKFDNVYWDKAYLKNGQPNYDLFAVGEGQQDPISSTIKNQAWTNFPGKDLPSGIAIFVYAFGNKYENLEQRNVAELQLKNEFLRNTTYEVNINTKTQYGEGSLDYIMGNPDDMVLTLGAGDNFPYKNVGQTKGMLPLNYLIPLAKLTSFNIKLRAWNDIAVELEGDKYKWELIHIMNRASIS